MLTLDVRHDPDGTTLITAVGAVDITTAARLSAAVHHELDNQPAAIVLDLTGVSSLDAVGLRVLHCAADRSTATAIPIRLICRDPSPMC
jgi:anti-sigma B factor antagonist